MQCAYLFYNKNISYLWSTVLHGAVTYAAYSLSLHAGEIEKHITVDIEVRFFF